MKLAYFTERPYRHIDEDIVLKNKAFFGVSNKYYDRLKGADDYNQFLDEYCLAEEVGFDGLALNEHHGNPYVFYFREKNGDPMGDGESFNLVIAPAKDRMKDMLFIGGDFNNQPFVAFGRQKQE